MNFVLVFLTSIIFPLAGVAGMHANKHTDVAIFTLIGNVSPVFTLLVAIPFLHETFTTAETIGMTLLIIAGIVATAAQLRTHARADLQGIGFSVLAAILIGVGIAAERFMLGRMEFGAYIIFGWGSQIFWATLFAWKDLHHIPRLFARDAKEGWLLTTWGVTNTLKAMCFVPALAISGAAIMSSATNFMAVGVVLAAYIFLHERKHMTFKWLATVIGIVGLFLIAN